jgi:peptidoglycan hydrolase-like protein with peptidoglycan-binding domain
MGKGNLRINLYYTNETKPVGNLTILVKNPDGDYVIYELITDGNGITTTVELDAPDKVSSLAPYNNQPRCGKYDVELPTQNGYKRIIVRGVEIFDGETSILPIQILSATSGDTPEQDIEEIFIPEKHGVDIDKGRGRSHSNKNKTNSLRAETAPLESVTPTSEILANDIVIPTHITVHLGPPNTSARSVCIPFADYIKNVASSEIFPTWNEAALCANIYAQISFALNRVYTMWYRNRGFEFDITSSSSHDQFFVYGRNIFENISRIVDNIFNGFLRIPGRREPFFAQYCSGTTATCKGMSQWGSQDFAVRGYTPISILRHYYSPDIQIVMSNNFASGTGTYPGTALREGAAGENVRLMQTYLNKISNYFYMPSTGKTDGIFGEKTKGSVIAFQRINNLVPDGIIGKRTWYAITRIYAAVKDLAELDGKSERNKDTAQPPSQVYPETLLRIGSRGDHVKLMQTYLTAISKVFPIVSPLTADGIFGSLTQNSVRAFQWLFRLTPDGIIGEQTWNKIVSVYNHLPDVTAPQYSGTLLRVGSHGNNVTLMQKYLDTIAQRYPSVPQLMTDGIFGPLTQTSVVAFQRLFGLADDGIIGPMTWKMIVSIHNKLMS